jgi:hypothetical protein
VKYIIVTGGVLSGLGKGVTSSSAGLLLQCAGYKVTVIEDLQKKKSHPSLNLKELRQSQLCISLDSTGEYMLTGLYKAYGSLKPLSYVLV